MTGQTFFLISTPVRAVLIMLGKLRTLFERNVEHAWSDKESVVNIHLDEYNGVMHIFSIAKLAPSLFSDSIMGDVQDPRTSHISLVQMSTRIIDCDKNWNFLFNPFQPSVAYLYPLKTEDLKLF